VTFFSSEVSYFKLRVTYRQSTVDARLAIFNGYSFSDGSIFDLITVDFWGEINLFSSKNIASSAAVLVLEKPGSSVGAIRARLQIQISLVLKNKYFQPEAIKFIGQFDFEKHGITELNEENYQRLFHIWDHPTHPEGFAVFLEKHLPTSEKHSFSFLKEVAKFSAKVDKSSGLQKLNYSNPNQSYFEELMKTKEIKFVFKSVLNVHNHFELLKKMDYETRIEEYAESHDFEKVAALYHFDEQKQNNLMDLLNNVKYRKLLNTAAFTDQDRIARGKISKTLASIVYGNDGTAKLAKMIQNYDRYFMDYFNPRDYVVPGIRRPLSEIVADLEVDDSKQAKHLKTAAENLWLRSIEEYRKLWINYLYAKYNVSRDNEILEGYVLSIMLFWFRKKQEESQAQQISDNF